MTKRPSPRRKKPSPRKTRSSADPTDTDRFAVLGSGTDPANPAARWFIDCDHDGHDALVPEAYREEWEAWLALDPAIEEHWVLPTWVIPFEGVNRVTFTLPLLP